MAAKSIQHPRDPNQVFDALKNQKKLAIGALRDRATEIADQILSEDAAYQVDDMQAEAYSEFTNQVKQAYKEDPIANSVVEMFLNSCEADFFASSLQEELEDIFTDH